MGGIANVFVQEGKKIILTYIKQNSSDVFLGLNLFFVPLVW